MKTKKRKCLVMLIAMLVPMTSVTLSGCNGKNEVSNATPDQATTQITTQQITTQEQTKPTVAETTQAPKPDYHEAYQAYKTVLKQNAFEIRAYDYQNKTDESKQIVFEDIMGDDTPELIFVKSVEDTYNDYTYVTLNIYTYSDGECKEISFKDKDEYQLQTSLQYTYDPYILFKSSDGKDLYLFTQRRTTSNVCRFFKFTTDNCEENEIDFKMIMEQTKTEIPNISNSGNLFDEEVGYDKCDKYKYNILDNMGSLLLYSDYLDSDYGNYYSPEKCKGMSYSEAMSFLAKYDSDSQNNADYSPIAGFYRVIKNGMVSSTVEIADDGTFKCEVKGFSADKYYESVCSGVITNLKKISDNKYTFNCSDTVIDDEPETRYINGKEWTIERCDNDFDTTDELTLYTEGTYPTDMREKDYQNYKFWNRNNSENPIPNKMIFLDNGSIYDLSSKN
jgi:hypothetical protein